MPFACCHQQKDGSEKGFPMTIFSPSLMATLPKIPSGPIDQTLSSTKQTWCLLNKQDPIPASAENMAMYVDYLSENNKTATIRRRINSLGTVLRLSKNHDPTKHPEVILALKRMHRIIGRAQQQATPLTKPLLNKPLSNCDDSARGLRNQVLLRL